MVLPLPVKDLTENWLEARRKAPDISAMTSKKTLRALWEFVAEPLLVENTGSRLLLAVAVAPSVAAMTPEPTASSVSATPPPTACPATAAMLVPACGRSARTPLGYLQLDSVRSSNQYGSHVGRVGS